MILGIGSLLKLWITVALSAGALVASVEVDSTLNPFKVDGERHPAIPAQFPPHSYYPSGLIREHPIHNSDEVVYVDEGPTSTDEDGDQLKRSMGMLRLGRVVSPLVDKKARSMAGLRLGRSLASAGSASAAEQSDAWRPAANSWKRTMGMLRLGRRRSGTEDDQEDEEGSEEEQSEEKRSMGMLRLGRQHLQQSEDSSSSAAAAGDKRSMGMLRLGRSAMRRMLSR